MKYTITIGNPPYQTDNHIQIYPLFYTATININSENVCLIFPTGWQQPKMANNLKQLNLSDIKEDNHIVLIDNLQNVFTEAEWVNIIFWKRNYDNNLHGRQNIFINGKDAKIRRLVYKTKDVEKPREIIELASIITHMDTFISLSTIMSNRKPYGIRTDILNNPEKYGFEKTDFSDIKRQSDVLMYMRGGYCYIKEDAIPQKTHAYEKYKVLIPYAWGNMDEKVGLGGAYSNITIAKPKEVCTETYLESGCFNDLTTAQYHAKYLMTQFARALLYVNKISQHSTTAWQAIPIQTYMEDWWKESIEEINTHLFDKYNIPTDIRAFVINNIQKRTENNIICMT